MLTAPLSTTPDLGLDDSTNTEASLLVASGLLILLLLCALLMCYKKLWALFIIFINISKSSTFLWFDLVSLNAFEFFFRKKQSEPIQTCAGQKVMYDDLRVSRIVDIGREYDIPACTDNSNKTDWISQERLYQARI